jgi:ABC-type polysaccharide/polyol phosphate transport system ATPase subunit
MSTCVSAQQVSKRFYLVKSRKTVLATLGALWQRESLRREHWVLRSISFEISRGEKVALIGRNGSGKTTLLRILAGIYSKTSGQLQVWGRPTPLLSCSAGMMSELSVVDNLYLFGVLHGISRRSLQEREPAILEQAELGHLAHSPLKNLSTGQAKRLALTVFAQTPSDFLLFDEVTANVDRGFKLGFEQYLAELAQSEKTVILTSHDASLLRRHCGRALWLDGGQLRRSGPADEVIDEYEASFQPVPLAVERTAVRA